MTLEPTDENHALQIQAGTLGRKTGHKFEDEIAERINALSYPYKCQALATGHVFTGCPARLLLSYVGRSVNLTVLYHVTAISTGALATSEEGLTWLKINGIEVKKCKSDLVITFRDQGADSLTIGVSTKQCNNATPTNAQLYFTTARAFADLLITNGIHVTEKAVASLRQFCGDPGFRPQDDIQIIVGRRIDPRRYFWEEIEGEGRVEWEWLLSEHQDTVTRLLLQKAYLQDPFVPEFLLHKTRRSDSWISTEVAIYSIDELVKLSRQYGGFWVKPYSVKKGSYRDPQGVQHHAPRFGIVQMQRGGQAQHPTQLQFNLGSGYFYKI